MNAWIVAFIVIAVIAGISMLTAAALGSHQADKPVHRGAYTALFVAVLSFLVAAIGLPTSIGVAVHATHQVEREAGLVYFSVKNDIYSATNKISYGEIYRSNDTIVLSQPSSSNKPSLISSLPVPNLRQNTKIYGQISSDSVSWCFEAVNGDHGVIYNQSGFLASDLPTNLTCNNGVGYQWTKHAWTILKATSTSN